MFLEDLLLGILPDEQRRAWLMDLLRGEHIEESELEEADVAALETMARPLLKRLAAPPADQREAARLEYPGAENLESRLAELRRAVEARTPR